MEWIAVKHFDLSLEMDASRFLAFWSEFHVPVEFIGFQGLNLVLAQMEVIAVTSKSQGRTFHLKLGF